MISKGKLKGAVAGAIGAVASEVVIEAATGKTPENVLTDTLEKAYKAGTTPTREDFERTLRQEVNWNADLGRLVGATAGLVTGLDAEIASKTGGTAAQHNSLVHVFIGGLVLWTAYDVYHIYDTQGPEAALQELAVQGVIQVATAGTGKIVYRVGGRVYPHAHAAWAAVAAENPVLYKAGQITAGVVKNLKDRAAASPALQMMEEFSASLSKGKGKEKVNPRRGSNAAAQKKAAEQKAAAERVQSSQQ